MKKVLQQIGEVLENIAGLEHFSITGKKGEDCILQINHNDVCSYHVAKYKNGGYSDLIFNGYDKKSDVSFLKYRYQNASAACNYVTKN